MVAILPILFTKNSLSKKSAKYNTYISFLAQFSFHNLLRFIEIIFLRSLADYNSQLILKDSEIKYTKEPKELK
jgi:hypothetical protein